MNYLLYGHGGSGNHGCEAIIRTTLAMIGDDQTPDVYTLDLARDRKFGVDKLGRFHQNKGKSDNRAAYMLAKAVSRLTGSYDMFNRYALGEALRTKGAVCLAVGGDNYCNGEPGRHVSRNRLFSKNNKTVLWGCSVTPELMQDPKIVEDMKRYSLITARESLTYEALTAAGVENARLIPDPAFTLQVTETALPDLFSERDIVGINISPTVMKHEKDDGILMQAARELVRSILAQTDYGVAFIPHVIRGANSDLIPMKKLNEEFKESGRTVVVDEDDTMNCSQLKYVISKCRFMVVARTHASIAAYSSSVPTLVIGYSVKSRGIARDLFGTEENYVLPVDVIRDGKELAGAFGWIADHEDEIRAQYAQIMPAYIHRAYEAGEYLRDIQ